MTKIHLPEESIEQQAHLSARRLKTLLATNDRPQPNRPQASLAELMEWVNYQFAKDIAEPNTVYIHNKIVIDGDFLQFCEEHCIKVECLYKDSVASWKSENGFEHFMAMGVFRITSDKATFIHSSLFHKGNQHEDEVSFFNVVADDEFDNYIILRNKFEDWQRKRDRASLEIEVVGGNAIPYTRDMTWDDLFMTEESKNQIKSSVEGFLSSKHIFQNKKVPWKRGLVFWGPRGCGKTSCIKIIISQYDDLKPVTIQPGHHAPDELLEEAFAYAEDHSPSLVFFEDLQELLAEVSTSHFLQLMDGVQSKNGILVIATGNELKSLEDNITNRPRRFDKKIEFPLPDKPLSVAYLKKWFGDILSDKQYVAIAEKTLKKRFTYAHLQEIYFTAIFNAVKNERDEPNGKDIKEALTDVIAEKSMSDKGFSTEARKDITEYV